MCLGAEAAWVPAVMSAVGTGLSMRAQSKTRDKQDAVAQYYQQQARQRQGQALDKVRGAIDMYQKPQQKMDDLTDEQLATLDAQTAPGLEEDFAGSAPDSLKKDIARRVVDSVEQGKEETRNMAELQSFGDLFQRAGQGAQDLGSEVGMLNDFTRGETDTMRFEMSQAPRAGQGLNTIADLFKAGGQMANFAYATPSPRQPWTMPQGASMGNWSPIR